MGRKVSRKRKVTRRRRVTKKRRVTKRKKARKPVKNPTGSYKSVWEGKASRTKQGFSKRSLCEFNGKIVPKKSLIGTKGQVFRGTKLKTKGGLVKKDLMKNKQGKVISKKRYATGRKNFKNGGIAKWSKAVTEARKNLGITGFYAVKKGTALYKEARKIYEA